MTDHFYDRSPSGSGLIGLLIVVAIILIVAAQFLGGGSDGEPGTAAVTAGNRVKTAQDAIDRGHGAADVSRQKRIELATEQFRINEGREPSSLQELVDAGLLRQTDVTE